MVLLKYFFEKVNIKNNLLKTKSHSILPSMQRVNCICCRLVLRCRQDARAKFAKMRSDVLVKMELLDQKHGEFNDLQIWISRNEKQ